MSSNPRRHVLSAPMVVHSGDPGAAPGVLPAGTSLRYAGSLPEGIDRYTVVVNVERKPLPLQGLPRPDLVEPITSFGPADLDGGPALGPEELLSLLRALGVRRADLEQLLLAD
jgi:hypothetical protein